MHEVNILSLSVSFGLFQTHFFENQLVKPEGLVCVLAHFSQIHLDFVILLVSRVPGIIDRKRRPHSAVWPRIAEQLLAGFLGLKNVFHVVVCRLPESHSSTVRREWPPVAGVIRFHLDSEALVEKLASVHLSAARRQIPGLDFSEGLDAFLERVAQDFEGVHFGVVDLPRVAQPDRDQLVARVVRVNAGLHPQKVSVFDRVQKLFKIFQTVG